MCRLCYNQHMDKKCNKCGVDKPLSEFYFRQPNPRNKRGVYSSDCKACIGAYRKGRYHNDPDVRAAAIAYSGQWKKANPERDAAWRAQPKNRETKRRAQVARMYGLPAIEYDAMVAAQNGVCAICGQPERVARTRNLTVDHDHITNAIRGLLCSNCNRAIGLLADSPEIIRKAADYVERLRFKEIGHA